MRSLIITGLFASLAAFGATILPITNPAFNGAITGSAPPGTTLASQLAEVNGIQGVKLYLESPFSGVPLARSNATLIANFDDVRRSGRNVDSRRRHYNHDCLGLPVDLRPRHHAQQRVACPGHVYPG